MNKVILNPRYDAKLLSKSEVAQDTYEFTFKVDSDFKFTAGQYVWLILPSMAHDDPSGNRRAMSIASAPNDRSEITLLMRIGKSGFKQTVMKLDKGDEAIIEGPFGQTFTLPEDHKGPLILIGAGVGIVPFLSIARSAVERKLEIPLTVISLDESAKRLPYSNELLGFCKLNKYIESKVSYKKLSWNDIKDIQDIDDATYYIAGNQAFVDYAYMLLRSNGVFDHQMKFENHYPLGKNDKDIQLIFNKEKATKKNNEDAPNLMRDKNSVLRLALESTTHHVVITDTDGRLLFANKAAQKLTGYSFEEMQGNTPRLWGGLMSPEFYQELWESKRNGNKIDAEITNRNKKGETYDVLAHIAPIKNSSNELIGYIGTEEDITDIKQVELEAKEQAERFRSLTDKIPEVYYIIMLQPEEKVSYVSPAFRNVWGLKEEAIYKNPRIWIEKIHPEDRSRVEEAFNGLVRKEGSFNIKYRVVRDDGRELWIQSIAELVLDEDGEPYRVVGVARDMTKEKEIDSEKTEFVSLASHQLKTPISSINWNTEALLNGDYGKLSKKQKGAIEEMYEINQRMSALVNGLLNISRIDLGTFIIEPEPADFIKLCEEILTEMKPRLIAKKHTIVKKFDKDLGDIPADVKLLRIVFQNYISNAIKYTPDNGHIEIGINKINDEIVVSISNNGDPIPKEDQGKIFSKMFRARNAQEQDADGNGLGLYLVKKIAENGGGKAWFDSGEGRDTVFYISFPLTGMIKKSGTKELD